MSPNVPKRLTPANLLEPDPVSLIGGTLRFASFDVPTPPWPERLRIVLHPRLSASVSTDVVALFETAQAAMAYGYYFYPLYALGTEHLFRAFEAAVTLRAIREGHSKKHAGLTETIRWLTNRGILSQESAAALKPLIVLRNEASHPKHQTILTPGMAIKLLDNIAAEINGLSALPQASDLG